MGKSFKKEVYSENSNRNKSKDYKRRKNQLKEIYSREEYDYDIYEYRKDKHHM